MSKMNLMIFKKVAGN